MLQSTALGVRPTCRRLAISCVWHSVARGAMGKAVLPGLGLRGETTFESNLKISNNFQ